MSNKDRKLAGYREARRMLGKKVGEIAEAKTPTGVLKLLVESITQA